MKLYEPFQFLTTEECDEIIAYGKPRKKRPGIVIGEYNHIRNNRVVWYKDTKHWKKWISMFKKFDSRVECIMDPQISYYLPGEHYDWHTDRSINNQNYQRHFTLTCNLQTAPGSMFELENINLPQLNKGEAVVFPSEDKHRATTPTSGERISLTIWSMVKNCH